MTQDDDGYFCIDANLSFDLAACSSDFRFQVIADSKPWLIVRSNGDVEVDWQEAEKFAATDERYSGLARAMIAVRDGRYKTLNPA